MGFNNIIIDHLNGIIDERYCEIGSDYADPYGQGRIRIIQ
jgi:hypothetical protein